MAIPSIPACLTIAGSDSGGGAGIQADLRAFNHFGTHGTCVITAVTAQNPNEVSSIHPIPVEDVVEQFRTVVKAINIGAIKTGMLFSADIIEALMHELLEMADGIPLVVDPVIVATSGAVLLRESAIDKLIHLLAPMATVITPNFPEAELLYGETTAQDEEAAIGLAGALAEQFSTAVLVKGGHLAQGRSTDILATDRHIFRIATPQVEAATTHGTGCMLSSAIAANLALGKSSHDAIVAAKAYVYHSLSNCRRIGKRSYAMEPPRRTDLSVVTVSRIR